MDQRVEEIRKETKDRKETNGHNEQYGRTQGHEDLSIPFFFYAPKSVFKLCAQPLARPFVLSLPVKHAYPSKEDICHSPSSIVHRASAASRSATQEVDFSCSSGNCPCTLAPWHFKVIAYPIPRPPHGNWKRCLCHVSFGVDTTGRRKHTSSFQPIEWPRCACWQNNTVRADPVESRVLGCGCARGKTVICLLRL